MTLPKIKLNKTEMTDADFRSELEKTSQGFAKFLEPGNHDLKIVKKEVLKAADKDPTWYNVQVTMENTEGAQIKAFIMVPTASLKYGPDKSMFPSKTLAEFFAAIGEDFTASTANVLLNKYFNEEKGLIGKVVNVDCGYKSNWIKWVSKDTYVIVDKNGHTFKDERGEPLPVFNTRDEAKAYAKDLNLKIDPYLNVLKYNPSEVVQNEDEGDDLPF